MGATEIHAEDGLQSALPAPCAGFSSSPGRPRAGPHLQKRTLRLCGLRGGSKVAEGSPPWA